MHLAQRLQQITPSKTVAFSALIAALRREGRRVIDFAVGEPAFETPPAVIAATRKALEQGQTRYGPVAGLPRLRERLAGRFAGSGIDNVIVSNGSKQALFLVFQTICNPGDEVIIPRPCWVSFGEQVKLAGGKPVFVDSLDHHLDLTGIKRAMTPRTRAVLINTPNNPTGAVYPAEDLEILAGFVAEKGIYLVSDEAYRGLVYDDLAINSVFDWEPIRKQVIVTGSFSKEFAMTGFRVGYTVAPKEIVSAMATLQSHMSGNVCTFAQHGALAALESSGGIPADQVREMEKKRDFAYDQASRLFDCIKPQGAFYLFPDVSRQLNGFGSSAALAAYLLETAGVAMVPGEAFGVDGHLRISYAVAVAQMIEGFERIKRAL